MDTHSDRPDDLNSLERRLSSWQPASAGLDGDAMLFAAGRASALPGPGRFVWPALTGVLSVLVAALGAWLLVERGERLALAEQLRRPAPTSVPSLAPSAVPAESDSDDALKPESYASARQALDGGLQAWPPQKEGHSGSGASSASDPVYQVGHRDALLDQQ
jgi:hypothetical protein